jgi:hypothetical protein
MFASMIQTSHKPQGIKTLLDEKEGLPHQIMVRPDM